MKFKLNICVLDKQLTGFCVTKNAVLTGSNLIKCVSLSTDYLTQIYSVGQIANQQGYVLVLLIKLTLIN